MTNLSLARESPASRRGSSHFRAPSSRVRRTHDRAGEQQVAPDSHVIDAELIAQSGKRPAITVETACIIGLVRRQAKPPPFDAVAMEQGSHGGSVYGAVLAFL